LPLPLAFYNYSGRFVFGSEFDVLAMDVVNAPASREFAAVLAFILTSCFCAAVLIVRITSRVVLTCELKWSSAPTEVILNPYCPDSSARLIVPGAAPPS
jgi:hypothetical protein